MMDGLYWVIDSEGDLVLLRDGDDTYSGAVADRISMDAARVLFSLVDTYFCADDKFEFYHDESSNVVHRDYPDYPRGINFDNVTTADQFVRIHRMFGHVTPNRAFVGGRSPIVDLNILPEGTGYHYEAGWWFSFNDESDMLRFQLGL